MKSRLLKVLFLIVLSSITLFAVSCTNSNSTNGGVQSESESIAKHECKFIVLKYNKTSHWYECECGAIDSSTISGHTGGMATCQKLAVCATCGQSYGDYKEHNIVDGECTVCENQDLGLRFALGDDESYYKVIGIGDYNDKDLVIPDEYNGLPVKEIAKKAFSECAGIESVYIGDNVTTIGSNAFASCPNLFSVYIGGGVESFGINAFYDCDRLISVEIAYGTNIIGERAFYFCGNLTNVTISNSVTTIGDYAFYSCSELKNITIPNSVLTIGKEAFRFCKGLTSVNIGDGVTTIGDYAFDSCTSLENVTIPRNVTTMGDYVFYRCSSLTSARIADGATTTGESTFQSCENLASVYIGSSITAIGVAAFSGCKSLTSVTIPDNVDTIGNFAFSSCENLTSVDLGEGVSTIKACAFQDCSSLTSIKIPNSVSIIEGHAFAACASLTSIDLPNSIIAIGDGVFSNCVKLDSVVLPDSLTKISMYTFRSCISLTSIVIPDNVTKIDDQAFEECIGLKSVVMGKGVKDIKRSAFEYCTSLTDVFYKGTSKDWKAITIEYFNDALKNATRYYYVEKGKDVPTDGGNYWHYDEDGNAKIWGAHDYSVVKYNDSQHWYECECGLVDSNTIESHFGGTATCKELAECDVCGQSYGELGRHSMTAEGCVICGMQNDSLEYVLSEDLSYYIVTSIGSYDDKELYIPSTYNGLPVKEIASQAFFRCNSLTNVVIGDNVTTIGHYAFFYCSSLTNVKIGSGVTDIGGSVFFRCLSLKNIEVDKNNTAYTSVDGNLYNKDCTALVQYAIGKEQRQFVIVESVESIHNYAFYRASSLEKVVIGKNVNSIGERVFTECYSLTNIEVDKNNAAFASLDGNLYNKDYTTLFQYAIGKDEGQFVVPNSVENIGDYAFLSCDGLCSVVLGKNVATLGICVFADCFYLNTIEVDGDNTSFASIDGNLYSKDCTILLQYAEGKTESEFTIPNSVKVIASYAFVYCDYLHNIVIPDSVITISDYAFYNVSFESVVIGIGVTIIDDYAFYACYNLRSIKYRGAESEWSAINKAENWDYETYSYTMTYNYQGK